MEIVTIEKKTFEEMKERFNKFSEHLQQLCSRYRPPEKMNWLDNADVCEKLNVSKRTLQTYRDSGRLAYSQINIYSKRRLQRYILQAGRCGSVLNGNEQGTGRG